MATIGMVSLRAIGGQGRRIDIPFLYKDAIFVMSHFDSMEIGLRDSPKVDEILIALTMTTGGRPHPRVPGRVKKEEVRGMGS